MSAGQRRAIAIERGRQWRAARTKLGLTLLQLGELLDTAPSTISYYESGQITPSGIRRRVLDAIVEALRMHPAHEVYPPHQLLTVEQRLIIILQLAQGSGPGSRMGPPHTPPRPRAAVAPAPAPAPAPVSPAPAPVVADEEDA